MQPRARLRSSLARGCVAIGCVVGGDEQRAGRSVRRARRRATAATAKPVAAAGVGTDGRHERALLRPEGRAARDPLPASAPVPAADEAGREQRWCHLPGGHQGRGEDRGRGPDPGAAAPDVVEPGDATRAPTGRRTRRRTSRTPRTTGWPCSRRRSRPGGARSSSASSIPPVRPKRPQRADALAVAAMNPFAVLVAQQTTGAGTVFTVRSRRDGSSSSRRTAPTPTPRNRRRTDGRACSTTTRRR